MKHVFSFTRPNVNVFTLAAGVLGACLQNLVSLLITKFSDLSVFSGIISGLSLG